MGQCWGGGDRVPAVLAGMLPPQGRPPTHRGAAGPRGSPGTHRNPIPQALGPPGQTVGALPGRSPTDLYCIGGARSNVPYRTPA